MKLLRDGVMGRQEGWSALDEVVSITTVLALSIQLAA